LCIHHTKSIFINLPRSSLWVAKNANVGYLNQEKCDKNQTVDALNC
jgi:hypothetical protein